MNKKYVNKVGSNSGCGFGNSFKPVTNNIVGGKSPKPTKVVKKMK